MFHIEFYQKPNGEIPIERFLDSLNTKMRVKAIDALSILEEFGNTLREPYSKSVGDGIFELRIKFSKDIARIFYFFFSGNKIILTNGFIKKTMKTPQKMLSLAKQYKKEYEGRRSNE